MTNVQKRGKSFVKMGDIWVDGISGGGGKDRRAQSEERGAKDRKGEKPLKRRDFRLVM